MHANGQLRRRPVQAPINTPGCRLGRTFPGLHHPEQSREQREGSQTRQPACPNRHRVHGLSLAQAAVQQEARTDNAGCSLTEPSRRSITYPRRVDVEEATVRAFVAENRQDRWLVGLASSKRRQATVDRLYNGADLRDDLMTKFSGSHEALAAELRRRGAGPTVHVIGGPNDGEDADLAGAVAAADHGYGGLLLVCVPGRLAAFFPEAPSKPLILATSG